MAQQNRFPNTQVRYRDTYGAGGITVRGIELQTDADGYIEGPADLEKSIEAHGFIRAETWLIGLPLEQRIKEAAKDEQFITLLSRPEADRARALQQKQRGGKE